MPVKDLTNTVRGLWTILKEVPTDKKYSSWLCKCQCGTEKTLTAPAIKGLHESSSCGCTRPTYIKVGDKFVGTSGAWVEVVEKYHGGYSVLAVYEDGTQQVIGTGNLRKGSFKNPNTPSVAGIGYIGQGIYDSYTNKHLFERWYSIFKRIYLASGRARNSSYAEASVCEEWHNFQNFAAWMEHQNIPDRSWHLDKDLLIKNNKIYSPDACVFLPPEVNVFFTKRKSCRGSSPIGCYYRVASGKYLGSLTVNGEGVYLGSFETAEECFMAYKEAKETYAKELAEKWKDQMDPRAYAALMNYQVEITD